MENEQRRSPRVMFSIPITFRGADEDGKSYEATGRTVTVNRHGARIQVSRSFKPGQSLSILNQTNGQEAEFRVIGPIAPPTNKVGDWGVECVHMDKNIWEIDFPPAVEDSDAHILLACRNCQKLTLQSLSLVEVEVLETAGLLTKPCLYCGEATSWGYPKRGFEVETQTYQAAVREATTGYSLDSERRKSFRKPAQLPVRVRDYYGEVDVAQTENISQEGLCFTSDKKYLLGQGIMVICPYDPANEKAEARARIVRTEFANEGERHVYGVHFDQPLH